MAVRKLLAVVCALACQVAALATDVNRIAILGCLKQNAAAVSARALGPGQSVPTHAGHAHNDYWHERPLLDALERGFCSVEADVFLRDGDLLVGHAAHELRPERTLNAVYLDPILRRLVAHGRVHHDRRPFTLLVDIKADGEEAYRVLAAQLEPLRRFLIGCDDLDAFVDFAADYEQLGTGD